MSYTDSTDAAWAQIEQEQYRHLATDTAYHTWLDNLYEEREMKTSEMIQSKFLKKEDFAQPVVLTIKGCAIEEVGRGDTRWVLYFNERPKGIVLNVTKIKQLEATFGNDTDMWLGKRIKVVNDPTVMMGQQVVGGIKFIMPPAAAKPVQTVVEPDFDDSIPF